MSDWTLEELRAMRDSLDMERIAAAAEYAEWVQLTKDAERVFAERGATCLGDLIDGEGDAA